MVDMRFMLAKDDVNVSYTFDYQSLHELHVVCASP